MKVCSITSTKGGVGKTTTGANLGALCADAGLKTLLIDTDSQPSLSSFFPIIHEAPCGFYEMVASNEIRPDQIISTTDIPNLSVIYNNDPHSQLYNMMLHAADGRIRLRNLLQSFTDFDLILIDTKGTRSIMQEMVVLASDLSISPVTPDMLAAREFGRGTEQLFSDLAPYASLGFTIPPLKVIINRLDGTSDAQLISASIRQNFDKQWMSVLETAIPSAVTFRNSATRGVPAHRLEYRTPSNRQTPAVLETMKRVAIELFPEWTDRFESLTPEAVDALVKGAHHE